MIHSISGRPLLFPKLRLLQIVETRFNPDVLLQVINDRTIDAAPGCARTIPLQRVELDYFASYQSEVPEFERSQSKLAQEYIAALEAGLAAQHRSHEVERSSFRFVHEPRWVVPSLPDVIWLTDYYVGISRRKLHPPVRYSKASSVLRPLIAEVCTRRAPTSRLSVSQSGPTVAICRECALTNQCVSIMYQRTRDIVCAKP